MQPLTSLAPKPALPVLNRPFIAHVLEHLAGHGVELAVINSFHRPDLLQSAAERFAPPGMRILFSRESTLLGTAGGLRKAARHFRKGTFYLVNADSLSDADLSAAASAHAASGRLATLIVRSHDPAAGYRPLHVSRTGRVAGLAGRSWGRARVSPRTFTGIHLVEPDVLAAIPQRRACDMNADVYPSLLDEDPEAVGSWNHEGWWFEGGNPGLYLEMNVRMLSRTARTAVVGPGFFIDQDARLERCVIGERARIEANARVIESVLWNGVTVRQGASLNRCIVTDGVELPIGKTWRNSLIMAGEDGHPVERSISGETVPGGAA
jgi:mannose-1-phosphate guanylyltransferase